ncbi:unnamed protein product [Vicia faba]|uniref:Uncharacterized protein n=1 Tax=Vicia faba TaxID=3906 RepID=A0AAV1AIM9_VICFA|nr:unnamed protein product [Vicia faba]
MEARALIPRKKSKNMKIEQTEDIEEESSSTLGQSKRTKQEIIIPATPPTTNIISNVDEVLKSNHPPTKSPPPQPAIEDLIGKPVGKQLEKWSKVKDLLVTLSREGSYVLESQNDKLVEAVRTKEYDECFRGVGDGIGLRVYFGTSRKTTRHA